MITRATLSRWAPAVLTLSVLLACAALVRVSWTAASSDAAFVADPLPVTVVGRPAWMSGELAQALAAEVADLSRPVSLLDADGLAAWSGRMTRLSPWIEGVRRAEPRFPGQVDVVLELARPVLQLANGLLVAGDGRVLGTGSVTLDPPPLLYPGAPEAESLKECAAAALELRPFRAQLEHEELGVGRVLLEHGSTVVFVTHQGVSLEWGRSGRANAFAAVDLPPAERVANLLELANRRPGLFGVERVVLWKDRPEELLRP